MCRISEQCAQFTRQPEMIVRPAEWQDTAYTQACGTCGVVGLVESSRGEQLWAPGAKSEGEGADTRLMNDGCRTRKHTGIRQVVKGDHIGRQLQLYAVAVT